MCVETDIVQNRLIKIREYKEFGLTHFWCSGWQHSRVGRTSPKGRLVKDAKAPSVVGSRLSNKVLLQVTQEIWYNLYTIALIKNCGQRQLILLFLFCIERAKVQTKRKPHIHVHVSNGQTRKIIYGHRFQSVPSILMIYIVSGKWIFKVKENLNGYEHYKARLLARGCEQTDSDLEIYASVAWFTTFRIFMAVTNRMNLPVYQLDVTGAFLYGDIK